MALGNSSGRQPTTGPQQTGSPRARARGYSVALLRGSGRLAILILSCISFLSSPKALAQKKFELGGFMDGSGWIYPIAPNEPDAHATGTARFQLWSRAALTPKFSWRGKMDFRLDTHRDIDRERWFDLDQRGLRQPAGTVSEFYFDLKLGRTDLRAGMQEMRWGRADGYNPTDNLIPYDYLDTFSNDRLAVPALKADTYIGQARIEAAWIPFYTPTRLPLLGQRWFPALPSTAQLPVAGNAPPAVADLTYLDAGGPLPARTIGNSQWGLRYNQLVPHAELSVSYFDGFDDIPYFRPGAIPIAPLPRPRLQVSLNREYYRVHVIGADFASGLGPYGIRGELAYFDQTDPANRDHLLFVAGVDRTWGDWFVIVQYAGQNVQAPLPSSALFPDLGLGSSLLWRVERSIGPSRTFEVKGALRFSDGDLFIQPLYSLALSNAWRLKIGATFFAGPRDAYLGQFRDNAGINLQLRYSF